ncbi:helix-turn-helix transcriptional regulator [Roseobacter sp. SK209-2-6]|uniref:helix-turn-helix transcriptional regulator n=1 Tax=Roseobacter sp. SK209-2-6 TaxID=388739 RepID=UPI00055A1F69|nr:helix-turn-helix transcriptional regulator [Roseobacter sp. SK209-2-6]
MNDNFSENLRLLCAEHGSISQICREIGINRQQFNRYLNGSSMPSAHNLRRIARHFDLSEKQLFGDPAELDEILRSEDHLIGESTSDSFLAPYRGQQKNLRRYLGFYHSHFCTPSWEGKIFVSLVRVSEKDGYVTCRSYENAVSVDKSIRQVSRYDGLVTMRGNRIYVTEHERTREGCVAQTILYSAHRQQLKYLRGVTMGVAWRPYAHPYAAKAIWKRLDERVTAREALERCGTYSEKSLQIDPTIRNYLSSPSGVLSSGKPM